MRSGSRCTYTAMYTVSRRHSALIPVTKLKQFQRVAYGGAIYPGRDCKRRLETAIQPLFLAKKHSVFDYHGIVPLTFNISLASNVGSVYCKST